MMTVALWKLGGLTPLQLAKRIWIQIDEDDVAIRSAALSYYFLLALFSLLATRQKRRRARGSFSHSAVAEPTAWL
jgi:hypothetical protein